jgi:hypothetical protein
MLGTQAELEHRAAFHHWGDDVAIAPSPHLCEKRFLRLAKHLGFVRQKVAKPGYAT